MSAYTAIDPILSAWARQKGVHVLTHHKDVEVRGVRMDLMMTKAVYGLVLSTSTE